MIHQHQELWFMTITIVPARQGSDMLQTSFEYFFQGILFKVTGSCVHTERFYWAGLQRVAIVM